MLVTWVCSYTGYISIKNAKPVVERCYRLEYDSIKSTSPQEFPTGEPIIPYAKVSVKTSPKSNPARSFTIRCVKE